MWAILLVLLGTEEKEERAEVVLLSLHLLAVNFLSLFGQIFESCFFKDE